MKKNISINISGIIFHVEEDGYELLKIYLESISRYFSTYEDNKEITDDIESRIAEIFLGKLSPAKQVVTKEDVESVMATMGSVEDFAAAEAGLEDGPVYHRTTYQQEETSVEGNKKLYRDTRRKIIGGVAAGIAQYFNTDPLWIRLIIIALFFADIFASMGLIVAITYIVMWIVVPGSPNLQEDEKIKKLYRNPDDKVIGGVCGGIAAYFGSDATLIRLIFVLSVIFFGTGIFIYIILWIITPEAKTLTEKMRMKGEPVTLSNIESSIKKNFNVNESGEESTLIKILLFPFRLVAVIISNLGRALGPLLIFIGEAARVILGLVLFLIGISLVFALFITGGIVLGIYTADTSNIITNLPIHLIQGSFPDWGIAFAYLVLLIPSVALLLAGITVIAKRRIVNSTLGWTALGFWFFCLAGLSVTLVPFIMDFQDEARYTTTETYDLDSAVAILTLQGYAEDDFTIPELYLRGHDSSFFMLRKDYEAHGRNPRQAAENAQMIAYDISVKDSVFIFPAHFTFREDAEFRFQELDMILYIPFEHPFMMDRNLAHILRNTLSRDGYSVSDMQDQVFIFTRNGLKCRTCESRRNLDDEFDHTVIPDVSDHQTRDYGIKDFSSLEVNGPFRVNIVQGEEYQVRAQGAEHILKEIQAKVDGGILTLDYDPNIFRDYQGLVSFSISMPTLSKLELGGSTQANVSGFDVPNLNIMLAGSTRAFVEVNTDAVAVHTSGASMLKLFGETQSFELEMNGASRLHALEFEAETVNVTTLGAARAQVSVNQELMADIKGASSLEYSGDPTVSVNEEGRRKVQKIN